MFNIWFRVEVICVILKMNACIMFDCFIDEILTCVNASDQNLDLPCTYVFDI